MKTHVGLFHCFFRETVGVQLVCRHHTETIKNIDNKPSNNKLTQNQ